MRHANAAHAYASAGIAVFPLMPRDKRPYGGTPGLHGATKDPALVLAWWEGRKALPPKPDATDRRPVFAGSMANIGIATGQISGFWVLDIDGPDGAAALAALEAQHGPLPVTAEQSTGKGRHILFAWPVAGEIGDRTVRNSASKIGPGIDVRGDGGYIVAAPSIHPSGRPYEWAPGRGPVDVGFAPAPAWLLELAAPPIVQSAPVQRVAIEGRATRYGEAALAGACRDVETAAAGTQSTTLWDKSVSIGALVAGGEIERSYAEAAMIQAGLNMVPAGKPWTRNVVESAVTRAMTWAENHPRRAPERRDPVASSRAQPKIVQTPAQQAQRALDGAAIWAAARPARCGPVIAWFRAIGLDPDGVPGALDRMRVHASVPDTTGVRRPHLLCPMRAHPDDPVDTLALFDIGLDGRAVARPTGFIGPQVRQRAAILTALDQPGPVVIGLDFADTWVLATLAAQRGAAIRAVAALTITNLCGGVLGDKYGRVDPTLPQADAARPPWLIPADLLGAGRVEVGLALRRDVKTHPLRVRAVTGGTVTRRLNGDAAATFFGSLAVQAWSRLTPTNGGSLELRLLMPPAGPSFHAHMTGEAA
ncbi:Bifunctional DNA primase/polymerase, N-terminal family [Brevundimonas sp. BAL3]|uniref:bifunctional DNA primase/polymerase n=1 Tax=Brevundimonas sp. BAL3 TaxID=391600 RepID=UPI00017EBAE1|nr:bifunctional DNA primase/polymerase [Brevundimonas sp. BAL3]EDX78986.1 Bifunctional DNA primase/polymerase, N-terminal family [Brevundimonas sp. BAL3]